MQKTNPIRILIADDHAVVRDGLAAVLEFQSDMTVVAHARDGLEAVAKFREAAPDITLMDLAMPGSDGVQAILTIREGFPEARIIVLTTYDGDENIFRALENGARGYLLKDCSTNDLLSAIRTVHAGGTHVSARAAARLVERTMAGPSLTPREIEVLEQIALGKSNKEIAALLFISEGTVKTHVLSIHEKLDVRDRTGAVVAAIKRGILRV
ncbi:MAG TPA: response regulator transcription factor [Bryobacteraceae bacterium]|jgi:two-component system NarL family response regulator|nr:response regulator transcription factor [Bryobacteraceae bacterium]